MLSADVCRGSTMGVALLASRSKEICVTALRRCVARGGGGFADEQQGSEG